MKILALDLKAFGPFTDTTLDLSGGREGLHLVHGPNEAGKSSTLRALSDFLFGVPLHSSDNFVHSHPLMRVGATLRDRDGQEERFVRRKGKGKTLVDGSGKECDDTALAKSIGSLTRQTFEQRYRIDHAQLVQGGKEISDGKGDFGQILFSAGAGLAGVRGVLQKLDDEMNAIFKPRGQNQTLNIALGEFDRSRKERDAKSVPTKDWEQENKRRCDIEAEIARLTKETRRIDGEKRRLERVERTLPVIATRADTSKHLDELAEVRELSDDFAERRRVAQSDKETAKSRRDDALATLDEKKRELEVVALPEPLLDETETVQRIQEDKGGYLKGVRDRPRFQQSFESLESDARSILAEWRPGVSVESAESLRLTAQAKKIVQELQLEHVKISNERETAEADVRKLEDGTHRPGVEAKCLFDDLTEARTRWLALGKIDGELEKGRETLDGGRKTIELALKRLPLWSRSLEELVALVVPSSETIERLVKELERSGRAVDSVVEKLEAAEAALAGVEEETEKSRLAGEVPTESDLTRTRGERDEAWSRIREVLKGSSKADASSKNLPESYEPLVVKADALSDRLRREADRVAEEAQRRVNLESSRRKRDELLEKRVEAERNCEHAQTAWVAAWATIAIAPATPREMGVWIKKRDELVQKADALQSQEADLRKLSSKRDEAIAEASKWFERLEGTASTVETDSLTTILARSKSALDRLDGSVKLALALVKLDQAGTKLDAWRLRWRPAVAALGLEETVSPEVAVEVLNRADAFFLKLKEVKSARDKVKTTQEEVESYERRVLELAGAHAMHIGSRTVEQLATEIAHRFQQGKIDADRRDSLIQERDQAKAKAVAAEEAIAQAEATLRVLRDEAGTDDFVAAEIASIEKKRLKRQLADQNAQLLALGEGLSLDRILAEGDSSDRDELRHRIEDFQGELEPLEAAKGLKNQELGETRERLARIDGGASAAEAEEQAQLALARIASEGEKYARLKIGAAVLREAVERYRKKNTQPVLDRAGKLFASLTLGSFSGLRLEESAKGEFLLRGVREADVLVELEGMSEGTADALYLALRLAGLHAELDRHDPIPFVVDDILVNLDNKRALAALNALAELSKRTQVLLFTHHEHLVELARQGLIEGETLFVHQLPGPTRSVRLGA